MSAVRYVIHWLYRRAFRLCHWADSIPEPQITMDGTIVAWFLLMFGGPIICGILTMMI